MDEFNVGVLAAQVGRAQLIIPRPAGCWAAGLFGGICCFLLA